MKILYISSWYPTQTHPNFGVFVKEHAQALNACSEDELVVAAVIIRKGNRLYHTCKSDIVEDGIRTIRVEINSRYAGPINYFLPLYLRHFFSIVASLRQSGFQPDIVHSNVLYPAGIVGYFLSKRMRLPHVITEHWSRLEKFFKMPVYSVLGRRAYHHSSKILPVSSFLQNKIQAVSGLVSADRFQVIGNVVDSSVFFHKDNSLDDSCISFCAIATWDKKKIPDKMPELFIQALSVFKKSTARKVKLTMIGGGDNVDALKELCAGFELDAHFTGYISKDEIAGILQTTHYFLHASTTETFGVVTAEALCCGAPVLCSAVGALPDLIHEKNGVLCANTLEEWIRGLNELTSKNFDRQSISSEMIGRFSKLPIGKSIHAVYDGVISTN